MTPRQRWHALFAGERPDRVPCDYWATTEVTTRLLRELNVATQAELFKRLGVDKCIYMAVSHPTITADDWHFGMHSQIWHIGTRQMPYANGLGYYEEDDVHPLAEAESVADVDRFDWPTADTWDYSRLREQCLQWPANPILCGTSEPFHLYCRLRGMERSLADLVECPDIAEAILEHIFVIDRSVHQRILSEVGDLIDLVYLSEDLGTQTSLLMSPRTFRRFLKPHMAALVEQAHAHGVKVMHHDDGANRPMLPDLVEIGIDILNPVQWRCPGMDREGLARDFGDRLIFHGGIDNQLTLPFGTPDDVRQQVAENIRIFRDGKGYIVASCHNLQPNTPTNNIVAMYEAVQELGWS